MSTRVAGAFLLGIVAGVVISEAVSRATRAATVPACPTPPADDRAPLYALLRGSEMLPDLDRYPAPRFHPIPARGEAPAPEAPVLPAPDVTPTRPSRPTRRLWKRKRHAMSRGMARVVRRVHQIAETAGYAAGLAVALAVASLNRISTLPALRVIRWEPAPVATYGRPLDGSAVRLAVRIHPLRGGPAVPDADRMPLLVT